jgi:tRNA(fMet)-specific endonuclease VapC
VTENIESYLVFHDQLIFSQITYFEILAGLEYKQAKRQIAAFNKFASECLIMELTNKSLIRSAKIYGDLRRRGVQIGTADLLIAGITLAHGFTLNTNNYKHYQLIDGLSLDNWKVKEQHQ